MGDFDQQMEALTDQLERQAERDAERAERKAQAAAPVLTNEERERQSALAERRSSLELARARIREALGTVGPGRYREQLERSLAAIEDDLRTLED